MSPLASALADQIAALVHDEVERQLAARSTAAPADDLVTAPEAAEIAGVHVESIRRWIKAGKLTKRKAGKTWRVSRRELDRLLRRGPEPRELTPEEEADLDAGADQT